MAIQTSAGATLAVSAVLPTASTVMAYEALTFTEVGAIKTFGEFGPTNATVSSTHVGDSIVRKFKGSRDNGELSLTLDLDPMDAGQGILMNAEKSFNNYAFVVTFQDGSKSYFPGKVMSYTTNIGEADQMLEASVTIGIDSIGGVGIVNDYM